MPLLERVFRKSGPNITREQSLSAIPVRNQNVQWEFDEEMDETLIVIPRRNDWWVRMLARFFFIPDGKRVTLDELGSFVWHRCDGQTTVGDLIRAFGERYKLSRKEAELSMIAFLQQMARKRLIGLAVPASKADAAGSETLSRRSRRRKKRKKVPG
jgi:hypothetical protein